MAPEPLTPQSASSASVHHQKQFQQMAFQPFPKEHYADTLLPEDGIEPPNWLHNVVLTITTPAHHPDDPYKNILDAVPVLHRLEILANGRLSVASRLVAPKLVDQWKRWSGPPPATIPIVQAYRTEVPRYSKSHGIADSLRLLGAKLASWLSAGRYPYLRWPDARQSSLGPWLSSNFPLGVYHGHEGRLVTHQEGSEWLIEYDRLSLLPLRMFRYRDINHDFVGVSASPTHVRVDRTTYILLVEHDKSAVISPSDDAARYRICAISNDMERGQVQAVFAAPASLPFAWGVTREGYAVVVLAPWRRKASFSDAGYIRGRIWACHWYDPHADTLMHVVDLSKGCLCAVYKTEAIFASSMVNCWIDDGAIVMDVNCYESDAGIRAHAEGTHQTDPGHLRRYRLEHVAVEQARFLGAAGHLEEYPLARFEVLMAGSAVEGAGIDPLKQGQRHAFVYGLLNHQPAVGDATSWWNGIVKLEAATGAIKVWLREGCFPASPPLYIARTDCTTAERPGTPVLLHERIDDDGVLALLVLNTRESCAELVVLDAGSLDVITEYKLPFIVPVTACPPVLHFNRRGSFMLQRRAKAEKEPVPALVP